MIYLDSSAIAKLLRPEAETAALRTLLAASAHPVGTAVIAETEVRRTAARTGISQTAATRVLDQLELVDLDRAIYTHAGLLPGAHLRSLDALHLAVALREGADEFVTYDARQAQAARDCGLRVSSPA